MVETEKKQISSQPLSKDYSALSNNQKQAVNVVALPEEEMLKNCVVDVYKEDQIDYVDQKLMEDANVDDKKIVPLKIIVKFKKKLLRKSPIF